MKAELRPCGDNSIPIESEDGRFITIVVDGERLHLLKSRDERIVFFDTDVQLMTKAEIIYRREEALRMRCAMLIIDQLNRPIAA